MENLVYLLPPLGCAAMMFACMWMMRRGAHSDRTETGAKDDEVAALREEVAQLRAERTGVTDGQP